MTIPDRPLGRALYIVRIDVPRPSRIVPTLFVVFAIASGLALLGAL